MLLRPSILVILASDFLYTGHAYSHDSARLKRAPTLSKKANSLLYRDMLQKVFAVYVSARIVRDGQPFGYIPEDIGSSLATEIQIYPALEWLISAGYVHLQRKSGILKQSPCVRNPLVLAAFCLKRFCAVSETN
jgi:hypothetical protein